jgi:hypothetical protein
MDFPIYFWFELLALLSCLIFIKKIRNSSMLYFVPYLLFIVVYEYGSLYGWFTIKKNNLLAVNIVTTIEFLFYSLFINSLVLSSKKKKIIFLSIISIAVIVVLNIVLFQGYYKLHTYSLLLSYTFLIFLSCNFFYELLDINVKSGSILNYSMFWLVTGILFFTLGQFTFFSFFDYIIRSGNLRYRVLFDSISNFSNAILYSCIIIAVLCPKKILI